MTLGERASAHVPAAANFPRTIAATDQVEPVPRRVRGVLGGITVFDTIRARYVWEWPNYPQYYVPIEDVAAGCLVEDGTEQRFERGTARRHSLHAGGRARPDSVDVYGPDAIEGVAGTARFDWDALDAWFEEDEQIHVHPRNPYVRVDALRSRRHVRVELGGVLLAESTRPVLVFETGLPTRYYVDRTDVRFEHLVRTDTATACPYKGVTSDYWSVAVEALEEHRDLAWSYAFPTRQLLPVAGLVAFYNEKLDLTVDSVAQPRPSTHLVS